MVTIKLLIHISIPSHLNCFWSCKCTYQTNINVDIVRTNNITHNLVKNNPGSMNKMEVVCHRYVIISTSTPPTNLSNYFSVRPSHYHSVPKALSLGLFTSNFYQMASIGPRPGKSRALWRKIPSAFSLLQLKTIYFFTHIYQDLIEEFGFCLKSFYSFIREDNLNINLSPNQFKCTGFTALKTLHLLTLT